MVDSGSLKAATKKDAVIRDVIQLELLNKSVDDIQGQKGEEAKEVRSELLTAREQVRERIEGYNSSTVRQVRALRSAVKNVGPEKAVSEMKGVLKGGEEARRSAIEAIQSWEKALKEEVG
jgi:hypothetical protein